MPLTLGGFGTTDLPTYGGVTEFPFQVVSVKNPNNSKDGTFIGVVSNSHLFNSEDNETYEEDNSDWGLLNDDKTEGGFSVGELGDKIWLEIVVQASDQSITSIDIKHGSGSGGGNSSGSSGSQGDATWENYPDPIEIKSTDAQGGSGSGSGKFHQTAYRQIIAEITDPTEDPRPGFTVVVGSGDSAKTFQVTQLLFTNIMMTTAHTTKDAKHPDLPLIVAIPWNAPSTDKKGKANEITSLEFPKEITPFALGDLGQDASDKYAFQMADASTEKEAKVSIVEGAVFTPKDTKIIPEGMGPDFTIKE